MTAPSGTGRAAWPDESARALTVAVRDRRRTIGLVLDDLGGIPGAPSAATFDRIAAGRPPSREITQWQVEDVLGWERGTLEALRRNPRHAPVEVARRVGRLVEIPAGDGAVPVIARLMGELTLEQEAALTALIRTRRARAS